MYIRFGGSRVTHTRARARKNIITSFDDRGAGFVGRVRHWPPGPDQLLPTDCARPYLYLPRRRRRQKAIYYYDARRRPRPRLCVFRLCTYAAMALVLFTPYNARILSSGVNAMFTRVRAFVVTDDEPLPTAYSIVSLNYG